jgi:hypothetical protein
MGYTTEFYGAVEVSPPLNQAERDYLNRFADSRRMDREHGPYFVEGSGFLGQGPDPGCPRAKRPTARPARSLVSLGAQRRRALPSHHSKRRGSSSRDPTQPCFSAPTRAGPNP